MNRKSIGILTYYWPPSGGSGVQRWLRFSDHLVELGWEVHVFTFKNPQYDVIDKEMEIQVHPEIKVNRIKGFEPSRFLKSMFSYKSKFKTYSNGTALKHGNSTLTLSIIRELFFFPDARRFLVGPAYRYIKKYYLENNLNYLVTTGPPHSMHKVGLKLKRDIHIKWVSDFRDPWSNFFQNKLLNRLESTQKKHAREEKIILKNADAVFTTSKSLNDEFFKINDQCFYIPSGFDTNLSGKPYKKFRILYAGAMKPIQNPKNLWSVLADLIKSDDNFEKLVEIVLIGNINPYVYNSEEFKKIKKRQIISPMSKNELDKEIEISEILVVCSVNMKGCNDIVPGKFFHYLSSGKKILGISNQGSDLENIIIETQSGKSFGYDNYHDLKNYIYESFKSYLEGKSVKRKPVAKYMSSNIAKRIEKIITTL